MPGRPTHHVFLVEHDTAIRTVVVELLMAEGYAVTAAGDTADALRLLQASASGPDEFCLALVDVLPITLDGLSVLRYLHDRPNAPPPVVLSTRGDVLAYGAPLGAVATLRKPFDLDELLAVVRQSCAHHPTHGI
jgi:two-component system OmpR family response regulator